MRGAGMRRYAGGSCIVIQTCAVCSKRIWLRCSTNRHVNKKWYLMHMCLHIDMLLKLALHKMELVTSVVVGEQIESGAESKDPNMISSRSFYFACANMYTCFVFCFLFICFHSSNSHLQPLSNKCLFCSIPSQTRPAWKLTKHTFIGWRIHWTLGNIPLLSTTYYQIEYVYSMSAGVWTRKCASLKIIP